MIKATLLQMSKGLQKDWLDEEVESADSKDPRAGSTQPQTVEPAAAKDSEMSVANPDGDGEKEKAESAESKDPGAASRQPQNQNANKSADKFFADPLWALAAEDVKIDSVDTYRDVMACRKRLRDTLAHKKRPYHAELVREGKKRLAGMKDALKKFKADNRPSQRAAIVDKAVVEFKLAEATEDGMDKEEQTLLRKLATIQARRTLLREVKERQFEKVVRVADESLLDPEGCGDELDESSDDHTEVRTTAQTARAKPGRAGARERTKRGGDEGRAKGRRVRKGEVPSQIGLTQ